MLSPGPSWREGPQGDGPGDPTGCRSPSRCPSLAQGGGLGWSTPGGALSPGAPLPFPSPLSAALLGDPGTAARLAHLVHTGDAQVPENPLQGGSRTLRGQGCQVPHAPPVPEERAGATPKRPTPRTPSLPGPPAPPPAPSHGRSSPRPWHCWRRRLPRPAAKPGRRTASRPWRSGGGVCGRGEVTPTAGTNPRSGAGRQAFTWLFWEDIASRTDLDASPTPPWVLGDRGTCLLLGPHATSSRKP